LASAPIALKLGNEYLPDIAPDLVLTIDEKFPLEKTKKGEIMDVPEDKGFTLKARTKAKAVKARLEKEAKAQAEAQAIADGLSPEEAKAKVAKAPPSKPEGKKLSEKLGETDLQAAKAAGTYVAKAEAVAKVAEAASAKGAKAEVEAKAANKAREAKRAASAAKAAEKSNEEKAARALKAGKLYRARTPGLVDPRQVCYSHV